MIPHTFLRHVLAAVTVALLMTAPPARAQEQQPNAYPTTSPQRIDLPAEQARLQTQTPAQESAKEAQKASACVPTPFGSSIFAPGAKTNNAIMMSPKQRVVPGDRIALALWGAIEAEEVTSVDSQGYIYVRNAGPILVAGQTEDTLAAHIQREINRLYQDVRVYAKLEQSAGTPLLVTGNVGRPGQYQGSAEDSVVVWLQRAGGILADQGSYRNIRVLRNNQPVATVDLYSFLQRGEIEKMSWQPQDVIVVDSPLPQVTVRGEVRRCAIFELKTDATNGESLIALAQPTPGATHAIVSGTRDNIPFSRIYSIDALAREKLHDRDQVRFYGSPVSQKITVQVEGPTLGNRILVLPTHTTLSAALKHVPVAAAISDIKAISLRRKSVALAQMEALDQSLTRLLQSVMTAPAQSDGEAAIRANEAQMVERFVMGARQVKPTGRVVVFQGEHMNDLPLEDGDIIVIPQKTSVVSVEGEVVLPRMVVATPDATAKDYVQMAGGFTERALKRDYVVIHPNGDTTRASDPAIAPGDRLLVLPRVDSKKMQTAKDLVQILYQVAVGAGVLISIDN